MTVYNLGLNATPPPEQKPEGKKNILNRVIGAVPSPIRMPIRGALDLMDTPRAAVMSTVKELRDLNNSRGFSFNDLVQQTRSNISAYEALDLQRLGRWGSVAGLGLDLAVGAATMPGTGTVARGAGKFARAGKLGAGVVARDAVERATLKAIDEINAGTGTASAIFGREAASALRSGATYDEAIQAGMRGAIHQAPDMQEAVRLGAKALVKGASKLTKAELGTIDRARTLTIGRRAIPGTEALAQKVADTVGAIVPKESVVRTITKQGYGLTTKGGNVVREATALRFAQNFDVLGQTGSRLRAAAIEAVDTGDLTRLNAELQATALRSKGLGAGSIAAHDLVEGSGKIATDGLRANVETVFGVGKAREALRALRQMPDRGVADALDAFNPRLRPGNQIGIIVRRTLGEIKAMDPQYWADNPDRWQSMIGSLQRRLTDFGDDISKANALPKLLREGKLAAAGQSDVLSNVITPWVESVGKELGASKIADPDALMRLAAANDVDHILAGGKTIKLGAWGDISEETFKRITGTQGGADDIGRFTRHFQGVTNIFKAGALASPAFSNRNFIGGVLNNFANGVTLRDTRWAAKQFERFSSSDAAVRATTDPAFMQMMARQGDAMAALTRGAETQPFAGRLIGTTQTIQQKLDKTGISARGLMTGTTGVQAPTEAVLRGAAFKHGLNAGLTEEGAWALAQKIHIDYQDLSHTDVAGRRVMPFWMWATRNPGLQAEYAARGMGVGNTLEMSMANSQESHAGDAFPPFIAGGALALGGGRTLDLSALPSTDLFKPFDSAKTLGDVGTGYLQQMNPALQALIEVPARTELGTGRPLSGGRLLASFFPPLSAVATATAGTRLRDIVPADLRSRSQLPGWLGKIGVVPGSPITSRQYTGA